MAATVKVRDILLEEKHRFEQELADLGKGEPEAGERREGSPFGKREEEAANAAGMDKRLALETNLANLIEDVDRALEKLDKGSYGLCDLCKEPIPPERLEALPAAHFCLKCKSAQDKRPGGRR